MASGFLLLLRFFLRVDGVLIRMNETRFYHQVSEKVGLTASLKCNSIKQYCLCLLYATIFSLDGGGGGGGELIQLLYI